jgi:hypothetical protein
VVMVSVPFAWHKIIGLSDFLQGWRNDWSLLFDKSDFGILRFLHFLALAYLAWVIVGSGGVRLQQGGILGEVIAVICRVGQQSLAVFAASMVMARVLGAVLDLAGGGALAALLVNMAGFAVIIAVARVAAYFKSQPWKTSAMRPAQPESVTVKLSEVRA